MWGWICCFISRYYLPINLIIVCMEALLVFLLIVAVCLVTVQAFSSKDKSPVRAKADISKTTTEPKKTFQFPPTYSSPSPSTKNKSSEKLESVPSSTVTSKLKVTQTREEKNKRLNDFISQIMEEHAEKSSRKTEKADTEKKKEARKTEFIKSLSQSGRPNDRSWLIRNAFFSNMGMYKEFKYFSIYDYYPVRYKNAPNEVEIQRQLIFKFKDGVNSYSTAKLVASTIYNNLSPDVKGWSISNTIFVAIPASTVNKNNKRFKTFCADVSKYLQIENGFEAINIVHDRDSMRGTIGEDKTKDLSYNQNLFNDKRVVLFDDIKTTGGSFKQNATRLKELGAREVIGVFLGETFDTYTKGDPYWIRNSGSVNQVTTTTIRNEGLDDDLPF